MIYAVNQKYESQSNYSKRLLTTKNETNQKQVSFGRALTYSQRDELKNLLIEMLKKLGIKQNVMVIHAPSFAPEISSKLKIALDKGVGSSCDTGLEKFLKFIQDLFGTTGLQHGPETRIFKSYVSPYSHGTFSQGEHLISLENLLKNDLISEETVQSVIKTSPKTAEGALNVDYEHYFDNFHKALSEAYQRFKGLSEEHELKKEFASFKKLPQIEPWLEKDAIYHNVLTVEHKSGNMFDWPELDKKLNFYLGLNDPSNIKFQRAQERLNEIRTNFGEKIELYEFQQFLIHKQKVTAKLIASELKQNIMSDGKIGNGINDVWAFPKAFIANLNQNTYSTIGAAANNDWRVYALNPKSQAAQDFLSLKMDNLFLYNHGTRLDAVFGYVEPFLHHHQKTAGKAIQDIGCEKTFQGDSLIKTIEESAKRNHINMDLIAAENLGTDAEVGRTREILKEYGFPEIHNFNPAMANSGMNGYGYGGYGGYNGYGGYGNGGYGQDFVKYLQGDVPDGISEQFNNKWYAATSHDTATLIGITNGDKELQKEILTQDFLGPKNYDGKNGWKRQFFFTDAFGIEQRYNNPNQSQNILNWRTRLPINYEKLYYRNVAKGTGYNLPEILLSAAKKKGIDQPENLLYDEKLINGLEKYSNILKEEGPYTTEEAEKIFAQSSKTNEEPTTKLTKKAKIIIGTSVAGITGFAAYLANLLKPVQEKYVIPTTGITPKNFTPELYVSTTNNSSPAYKHFNKLTKK